MVNEIFLSLEGETATAGFPAVFIRLAGCNLNCRWCDTPDARSGGAAVSLESVLGRISPVRAHHVTVTGGEPLRQEGCADLLERLVSGGRNVQLETNGSIPLDTVPAGVRIIADVKTPSSGEEGSFLPGNLSCLGRGTEVKFIIADENDYRYAADFMAMHLEGSDAVINLSPVHGEMPPERLAGWMLRDMSAGRINLQLHKIIWGEREGKILL